MSASTPSRRLPNEEWEASAESDIAVALVRTAFIIAFALFARPPSSTGLVQMMLLVAAGFNLVLFGSYLWGVRLFLKRPIAIIVDLMLVTTALASFRGFAERADWLVALYYLVVMTAAIWFRPLPAITVSVMAGILYGVVSESEALGWGLLRHDHSIALVLVGVTASYITMALERERTHGSRLEHEMVLARLLHDNMFPADPPAAPGLDIGVRFQPARAVGGDVYDVMALDDGTLLFCVGDMAGKSVYGLFHLSLVHSHIRAAVRQSLQPAEIAEAVNRNVYEALQPSSYAALFICVADPSSGTLQFVNCGHLPPLLVRGGPDGGHEELSTGNIVIGGMQEPGYRQEVVSAEPGDVLVCYTDGITEARSRRGEEFGEQRLVDIVRENPEADADALAQLIMDAAERFSVDASADDRTLLILRVTRAT